MKQSEYVEDIKNIKSRLGKNDLINLNKFSELKIENIFEEPRIGLDKTLRNNKNILFNTFDEVDLKTNYFKPLYSNKNETSFGNKKNSEKNCEINFSSQLLEKSDWTSNDPSNQDNHNLNRLEEIHIKNSKKMEIYKNEGCLVVFDERQEIQKNYKINFTELLNVLINDPSTTQNFFDGSSGKWIEDFVTDNNNNHSHLQEDQINLVEFESRFENGNLRMAIRVADNEYDLILRKDINSEKTSNWFLFEVKIWVNHIIQNCKISENSNYKNNKFIFNIINLEKKESLFSKGLRVLKYSAQSRKWSRDTYDVLYFPNGLNIFNSKSLYTLTFSFNSIDIDSNNKDISIKYDLNIKPDIFYFSYCFPYTFTTLNMYLLSIHKNDFVQISTIGKSLCNNPLYMLTITNFESIPNQIAMRPAIILTARIHPGESNSSIVIQGVIDFLISEDNPIAKELRDAFIFQIVPMLNPDGVINGNYRSCVNGKDLNRMWVDPRESVCPTLFHTKEMIKNILKSRKIYLYCDFHGHSNKNNFFIFSCPVLINGEKTKEELYLLELLSKLNDSFDKDSCIVKLSKGKTKTARAVMKNEMEIKYSYCLESSIGGITQGEKLNRFYTPEDYLRIGMDFCVGLSEVWKRDGICNVKNENPRGIASNDLENIVKRNKKKSKTNVSNRSKDGKITNNTKIKIKENAIYEMEDDFMNKQKTCSDKILIGINKNEKSKKSPGNDKADRALKSKVNINHQTHKSEQIKSYII